MAEVAPQPLYKQTELYQSGLSDGIWIRNQQIVKRIRHMVADLPPIAGWGQVETLLKRLMRDIEAGDV